MKKIADSLTSATAEALGLPSGEVFSLARALREAGVISSGATPHDAAYLTLAAMLPKGRTAHLPGRVLSFAELKLSGVFRLESDAAGTFSGCSPVDVGDLPESFGAMLECFYAGWFSDVLPVSLCVRDRPRTATIQFMVPQFSPGDLRGFVSFSEGEIMPAPLARQTTISGAVLRLIANGVAANTANKTNEAAGLSRLQ